MIDVHSKYDNMHKNEMFYVLICFNSHVIISRNFMLSLMCDPLGPYISLINIYIDSITSYWLKFINYLY